MSEDRKPKTFLFSLLLPLIWFSIGGIMAYFFPGKKLGIGGLALIVYLSITPVCWILAKSFGRYLRRSEKFKLIGYYTLWALICEFWGLWYYLSLNSTPSMEGGSL